jgi:cytochrome c oxidase subunit 2
LAREPDLAHRELPDGVVPEEIVVRSERRWFAVMLCMLALMLAVIVFSGVTEALHPPSNVETIDPLTLHQGGEFAESNLGTAAEPGGAVTVRMIAQQYSFVPSCVRVPAGTAVTFRLTSADVLHGFQLIGTNVNSMVMPGFISEVRTTFDQPGDYRMPCHEYCGGGHQGMWARVVVVPKPEFPALTPLQRASCAK